MSCSRSRARERARRRKKIFFKKSSKKSHQFEATSAFSAKIFSALGPARTAASADRKHSICACGPWGTVFFCLAFLREVSDESRKGGGGERGRRENGRKRKRIIIPPLNQTASQIVAMRGLLPRKQKLCRSPSVVPGAAALLSLFSGAAAPLSLFPDGGAGSELEGSEARNGGAQLSLCPTVS